MLLKEEADAFNNIIKDENAAVTEAEENYSGRKDSNVADEIEEEKVTARLVILSRTLKVWRL